MDEGEIEVGREGLEEGRVDGPRLENADGECEGPIVGEIVGLGLNRAVGSTVGRVDGVRLEADDGE